MEDQTESPIMPIVRHVMQAGGSILATSGVMTEDDVRGMVGILISLVAVAWGVCRRRGVKLCQY